MEGVQPVERQFRAPKIPHRKWTVVEDEILVGCMVELHNIGTYNADTGFRCGYLNELERMLSMKIPNNGIKAKPHIESRIRTLKKDWSIVYDMVYGRNTSGFGWDPVRKMVLAEKEVWDAYILSHKDAATFMNKSFRYLDEFTMIYGKDRATGRDAQTAEDIIDEIDMEEAPVKDIADDMPLGAEEDDVSIHQSATRTSTKRKRNMLGAVAVPELSAAIKSFDTGLRKMQKTIERAVKRLSIDQSRKDMQQLNTFLRSIEGISQLEMKNALLRLPKQKDNLAVLYSLPLEDRLDYLRSLLHD